MDQTSTGRINGLLHRLTAPLGIGSSSPKIQPVGPSIHARPEPPPPEPPPPEIALKLDERSKSLLTALSQGTPSDFGYGNTELATELLKCEQSVVASSKQAEHNRAIVQRLAMVSRMIASVDADPSLSEDFKQSFGELRFTLIKSALADVSFLTQPRHPLRAITAEVANRAAEAGPDDSLECRRLRESLRAAINDFDLSAAFVRPIMQRLRPLDLDVIRQFWAQVEELRDQRSARRRARNIVTSVIASRLKGVKLPAQLLFVLEHEWAAVLTHRLVQSGTASDAWREGVGWLEQVLSQARTGRQFTAEVINQLEAGLLEAGRSVGPAVEALQALAKADKVVERAHTLTDTAEVRLPPLGRLLYAARWFRVFDHTQQKVRWLQATRYDATGNLVEFSEMDGCNTLHMSADQFAQDLRAGLSAPNTPDEQSTALLAELRAEAA